MSDITPHLQSLLDQRASTYAARNSESSQKTEVPLQLLLCRIGEHIFALELTDVMSVSSIDGWVSVPHTYPALLGVLHANNELVSLFDTAQLIQCQDGETRHYSHAVILKSETQRVALACTALLDLISLAPSAVMENDTFHHLQSLVVIYRPRPLLSQLAQDQ